MWPSSVKGRPWTVASSRTAAEKASLRPARRRVAATRSASAWSGGARGPCRPWGRERPPAGEQGRGRPRARRRPARPRAGSRAGAGSHPRPHRYAGASPGCVRRTRPRLRPRPRRAGSCARRWPGRRRSRRPRRRGPARSELDGGRHRLGHDRGVVVEQRRSRRVGRQERRAAGLRLDLDDGLLEEAGHAALEALAATDHYGVGAELLAHLGEGVGQAAGAEGLGGGGGVHREGSLLGSRDTTGEQ